MTVQASIQVFATCSQSSVVGSENYLDRVVNVARWSEQNGCKGILVYSDNSLVDPWLIAQIILQSTDKLCPLVAVQPVYMHPYSVAKMVSSLGHLYGRRIFLNMIAGGFKNDLTALNDLTAHDNRYDRLIEYTTIIKELLAGDSAVSYQGQFYKVDKLRLLPPIRQDLFPGIFVSGSSEAGLAAANALGATAIKYPAPIEHCEQAAVADGVDSGIRVGIIAREDHDEAWKVARQRFPEDRRGQMNHHLAMKVSDSAWHRQLSLMGEDEETEKNPYWLVPFKNYKTFCPYLVGSYSRVAEELARYLALGFKTFILDIPPTEEELRHTNIVFELTARWEWGDEAFATTVGN